jgi:hypothetical protein
VGARKGRALSHGYSNSTRSLGRPLKVAGIRPAESPRLVAWTTRGATGCGVVIFAARVAALPTTVCVTVTIAQSTRARAAKGQRMMC